MLGTSLCALLSCELAQFLLACGAADKFVRLRIDEERHAAASSLVKLLKLLRVLFVVPRLFLLDLDSLRNQLINDRHHLHAVRARFAVELDEHRSWKLEVRSWRQGPKPKA